jgi:hypothetical protein
VNWGSVTSVQSVLSDFSALSSMRSDRMLSMGYSNVLVIVRLKKTKTKLHGLSPRANYIDRATAAYRRRDCQLFCRWKVPPGQRDGSLQPYCRFSRQESLLFYQVAPQLYSRD